MNHILDQSHLALIEKVRKTPEQSEQDLFQQIVREQALNEEDWLYLAWVALALTEAKKSSNVERTSASSLAVVIYFASELTSNEDVAVSS